MNKIDKKTVMLGILALGITTIPLSGAFIYKNMQNKNVSDIAEGIEKIEKDMGLSIHIQNEDIFNLMHRV